jgi:transposase InsO family protein
MVSRRAARGRRAGGWGDAAARGEKRGFIFPIRGEHFHQRITNMGIEEVKIAPRSPWQNPYCERVIGSIRRDLLDHVIVLNERHLRRVLQAYFAYYHDWRTHRSLEMDAPMLRPVQGPELGAVRKVAEVSGLHHHYDRQVA